jgi:hypothetical protein
MGTVLVTGMSGTAKSSAHSVADVLARIATAPTETTLA